MGLLGNHLMPQTDQWMGLAEALRTRPERRAAMQQGAPQPGQVPQPQPGQMPQAPMGQMVGQPAMPSFGTFHNNDWRQNLLGQLGGML